MFFCNVVVLYYILHHRNIFLSRKPVGLTIKVKVSCFYSTLIIRYTYVDERILSYATTYR